MLFEHKNFMWHSVDNKTSFVFLEGIFRRDNFVIVWNSLMMELYMLAIYYIYIYGYFLLSLRPCSVQLNVILWTPEWLI